MLETYIIAVTGTLVMYTQITNADLLQLKLIERIYENTGIICPDFFYRKTAW